MIPIMLPVRSSSSDSTISCLVMSSLPDLRSVFGKQMDNVVAAGHQHAHTVPQLGRHQCSVQDAGSARVLGTSWSSKSCRLRAMTRCRHRAWLLRRGLTPAVGGDAQPQAARRGVRELRVPGPALQGRRRGRQNLAPQRPADARPVLRHCLGAVGLRRGRQPG